MRPVAAAAAAQQAREAIEHYAHDEEGCSKVQKDIATQLIDAMLGEGPFKPNRTVDIALGGGREMFLPKTQKGEEGKAGKRIDGVNLIQRFQAKGGQYAWTNNCTGKPQPCKTLHEAAAAAAAAKQPLLGLFEPSHMMYDFDRRGPST